MRSIILMTVTVLGFTLFLTFIGVAASLAQPGEALSACAIAEATRPYYNAADATLVLADAVTGEPVRVLEANLATTELLGYSPDCQYLVGAVGPFSRPDGERALATVQEPVGYYLSLDQDVAIWDAASGARVATFTMNYRRLDLPRVSWGEDGSVTIHSGDGDITWRPAVLALR